MPSASAPSPAPLRILIAPDKFKASLSASEAAGAMRRGVEAWAERRGRRVECIERPLADGGEGSLDALHVLQPELRRESMELPDAVGAPRSVESLRDDRKRAVYLETARVLGLELSNTRTRPVEERSSAGVGRWIRELARRPDAPRELHLFLGGSGTCDGGAGLAEELGVRWSSYRRPGVPDSPGQSAASGAGLELDWRPEPELSEFLQTTRIRLFADVRSPLLGPDGAARMFAPQKGAGPEEVERLEARMAAQAAAWERWSGRSSDIPGAGAAGGLALPLLHLPFAECSLRSGSAWFVEAAGLSEFLQKQSVDLVLTGEGRADRSSLAGKAIAAVRDAVRASRSSYKTGPTPQLALLCGQIAPEERRELACAGFDAIRDTLEDVGTTTERERWPLDRAEAAARLARSAERLLDELDL